ncbi:MAG: glycosyltransferase family 9 protein [Deltaproteobacteria bacterium]|nr:glycosyltransferase family 9 protein [Deltaproteobacteria bacterium]
MAKNRARLHRKVLIIQLTRMGDLIQTIPLLKGLFEQSNPSHITLVCVREFSRILDSARFVHRFLRIPASDVYKLCKAEDMNYLTELATHPYFAEDYDLVINLTHDYMTGLLANRVKAAEKAGVVHRSRTDGYIPDRWGRYLFAVVRNRRVNTFNLVDIHMGIGKVKHKPMVPFLTPPSRARRKIDVLLSREGIHRDCPIICIHPGANLIHRTWPIEYFASLAEILVRNTGVTVVITGFGRTEEQLGGELIEFCRKKGLPKSRIVNMVGKTGQNELVALMERAILLVTNDTGPIHIAAAVGTPTVGIYLSTAFPGETAPYGSGHVTISPALDCYPCLRPEERSGCGLKCRWSIKPEIIFDVASAIIDGRVDDSLVRRRLSFDGVAIMQSRFMSNGTLIYLPCNEQDGKAFAHLVAERYAWEGVLGLNSTFELVEFADKESLLQEVALRRFFFEKLGTIAEKACQNESRRLDKNGLHGSFARLVNSFRISTPSLFPDYFVSPLWPSKMEEGASLWRLKCIDINIALERLGELEQWIKSQNFQFA